MAQVTVLDGVDMQVTNQANSLIQNLGPGILYLESGAATVGGSLRVAVGEAVSILGNITMHGIASSGDCDVRILTPASGIHG